MARKPRPVDPADGPIPAFAFDLRKVREEAGEPTYRALAALAGFSATTLSDAAGGVRFPSLEVTLAYVGACGGDVAGWERRWRELDRALAADRTPAPAPERTAAGPAPVPGTASAARAGGADAGRPPAPPSTVTTMEAPAPGAPPTDLVDSGPARAPFPSWARWSAAVTVVTVAAVFGILALHSTGAANATGQGCPRASGTGAFHGTTYNVNTVVRAGANLGSPVVMQAPSGCTLQFTGYCLGDVVVDITSGTPDMRWFEVRGGGVVSSGVVHGNPPDGMRPSDCPDSVPAPGAVELSAARPQDGGDSVELRASGKQIAIVGFAAYFAEPDGSGKSPGWRQIGLSDKAGAAFAVAWRYGPLRQNLPAGATVPVVAVACLGGEAPTDVLDALNLPLAPSADPPGAAALTDTDRTKAEQAACKYPLAG